MGDPPRREWLDEPGREIVEYLDALVAARSGIERFVREFREDESQLTASAFEKTRELLPESADLGAVRYVVLPLGLDFRTDRETVYMDPLAAVQYGRNGVLETLSHELHHVARFRLTGDNLTLMRPGESRAPEGLGDVFRTWAAWLEAEGIADGVSNLTQVEIPFLHDATARRRHQMETYEELLTEALRPFLVVEPGHSTDGAELSGLSRRLLGLAHPVGARMAEHIRLDKGRSALIECVGHPDRFVRRYDEIALRKGLAGLGEASARWLTGA